MLRYKNIYIGNQCNNKCLHCPYRQQETSQPDLQKIIASLNDKPSFIKDGIAFYGGEPTLRSDLFEIIHKASTYRHRRIKLITNGRALSDIQFLEQILNAGCYLFEIKLWSYRPELHDYLTQIQGSFWQTMSGLENLAGYPAEKFVCVKIPVCKENYTDIENTVATVLNIGANRIVLSIQDNKLSFQEAFPHIRNAIQISIFNRIWILTEGLPLCAMHGFEHYVSEIYSGWDTLFNRIFQHHRHCSECVYSEICPGIDTRYLDAFGEKKFAPVAVSKHFEGIKALYE